MDGLIFIDGWNMPRHAKTKRPSGTLKLAWRIGLPHYETDDAFDRLLELVKDYHPIMDEAALFDSITHHMYIPLDTYARRAELMGRRLRTLRQAGVASAGINVLCTIGHINEGWSYMPPLPFQAMVGHDGSVSTGCACPNTPEMHAYVRAKYELVARAQPDFVWVDDDIRMHHHGVAWGCFCPTCLGIFSRKAGKSYTREKLVEAFNKPANGRLRELWVQQNIETIQSLMADISAAIHKINPEVATGLMTAGPGWTTYSGQAFDRWCPALKASKGRPGGGFYSDETPVDMYNKAVDVGWQRVSFPPDVTDLQYELENFPYQILKKSAKTVVNECTLALAYGLNGIAFNMLALDYEDFLPILKEIPPARPMWEKLVAHTAGLPTAGLWTAWSSQLMAKRSLRPGENWLAWDKKYDINRPKVLGKLSLPLSADRPGCATVLCGRVAEAFDDDQLKTMLAGGVLMDSITLDVLLERGLDRLAGVRVAKRLDNGMMERFTGDELNGSASGQLRDARIEFWGDARGMADVLEPVADGVRILATLEDYFNRGQGSCMSAFENSLGGRVVVMGYAPWIFLHSVAKRAQLLNAADWISRGKIPVRIDQPVPLIPIVRMSADRRTGAIVLLNSGFDEIREATLHVRSSARHARLLTADQKERLLRIHPEKSGWRVTLRDIAPWSILVILFGE